VYIYIICVCGSAVGVNVLVSAALVKKLSTIRNRVLCPKCVLWLSLFFFFFFFFNKCVLWRFYSSIHEACGLCVMYSLTLPWRKYRGPVPFAFMGDGTVNCLHEYFRTRSLI
jgi:hypothetical protein